VKVAKDEPDKVLPPNGAEVVLLNQGQPKEKTATGGTLTNIRSIKGGKGKAPRGTDWGHAARFKAGGGKDIKRETKTAEKEKDRRFTPGRERKP